MEIPLDQPLAMTQASTSSSHPRSSYSSTPTVSSCARSASYPPTTFSTLGRTSSTHSGSVLQKLGGFFSPRKHGLVDAPPEMPPLTPTSASNIHIKDGITAAPRRSGEEFEKVFRYFDQNGDGKISPSELRCCMRAVGEELSAEEAEAVVESTDSDGDGLLGFEDFVKLVDVGREEERTRDLREAFNLYEMKGQGCITPKSLRRMLRRLGESKTIEQCKVMIQRFDLNGDGVLSFDEFKVMML